MNKTDFGLYRDNGPRYLRNTSGHVADRKRKNIIKIFKEYRLSITCGLNKKIIDFLDLQFNFNDQTYEPFRKPNNEPAYVSKQLTIHRT